MKFSRTLAMDPLLRDQVEEGIDALEKSHRNCIADDSAREARCSINLEQAFRALHPQAALWDYGVGMIRNNTSDEAVWIEFHPAPGDSPEAADAEVSRMLKKLAWLKQWLAESGYDRHTADERPFLWVKVGKGAFSRSSPQARRAAEAGLALAWSRPVDLLRRGGGC